MTCLCLLDGLPATSTSGGDPIGLQVDESVAAVHPRSMPRSMSCHLRSVVSRRFMGDRIEEQSTPTSPAVGVLSSDRWPRRVTFLSGRVARLCRIDARRTGVDPCSARPMAVSGLLDTGCVEVDERLMSRVIKRLVLDGKKRTYLPARGSGLRAADGRRAHAQAAIARVSSCASTRTTPS